MTDRLRQDFLRAKRDILEGFHKPSIFRQVVDSRNVIDIVKNFN
ncbi:hypothetical protein D1BOALGB6SA_9927 [Olavius sp. associated proteobacterium Delta 1]|nr:hypothetical protein D1BOALGB6SA_9927 [Olavius sp. associated proteobacterium Delta 1]